MELNHILMYASTNNVEAQLQIIMIYIWASFLDR